MIVKCIGNGGGVLPLTVGKIYKARNKTKICRSQFSVHITNDYGRDDDYSMIWFEEVKGHDNLEILDAKYVKCIDNKDLTHRLTLGKVYEVDDIRMMAVPWYLIGDDTGEAVLFNSDRFKVVTEELEDNKKSIKKYEKDRAELEALHKPRISLPALEDCFIDAPEEFSVPSIMDIKAHNWFISNDWGFNVYISNDKTTLTYSKEGDEIYVRFPQRTIDVVSDGGYIGNAEFVNIVNYLKEIDVDTDLSKMKGTREE